MYAILLFLFEQANIVEKRVEFLDIYKENLLWVNVDSAKWGGIIEIDWKAESKFMVVYSENFSSIFYKKF